MSNFFYVDNGISLTEVVKVKESYIKEIFSITQNLVLRYDSKEHTNLQSKLKNVNEFIAVFKMQCNSCFGVYVSQSQDKDSGYDKKIRIFPLFSNTQFEPLALDGTVSIDSEKLSFMFFNYFYSNGNSSINYNSDSLSYFRQMFISDVVTQMQMYRISS